MVYEFERTQRIAVLGGGPGGYEAALAAAQLGREVTLVERAGVGGAAVLTDVVPSKSLIATAEASNAVKEAADLGVQFFAKGARDKAVKPQVAINLAAVNKRLLGLAAQQSEDMRPTSLDAGVRLVQGEGRLDGPNAVIVSTAEGGTDFDRIEADTLVISVGATPRVLPTAGPTASGSSRGPSSTPASRCPSTSSSSAPASPAPSSPRRTARSARRSRSSRAATRCCRARTPTPHPSSRRSSSATA